MDATEYLKALNELYKNNYLQEVLLEKEFLLSIDYKLGKNFPEKKRFFLLEANKEMRLQMKKMAKNFLTKIFTPQSYANKIHELTNRFLEVIASVLSEEEFEKFTGFKNLDEAKGISVINPDLIKNVKDR